MLDETPKAPEHAGGFISLSYITTCMVGATGFEPATSCSRSRRATGLRYAPPNQPLPKDIVDAPGGTRIPNLLIRSQMLYPIELRALSKRRLHRPVKLAECRHGL